MSGKFAITEMLNRSEFDGRPDGFLFKYRSGGIRQGILFTDTDVWHSQRRYNPNKYQIWFMKDNLLIYIYNKQHQPLSSVYIIIIGGTFLFNTNNRKKVFYNIL